MDDILGYFGQIPKLVLGHMTAQLSKSKIKNLTNKFNTMIFNRNLLLMKAKNLLQPPASLSVEVPNRSGIRQDTGYSTASGESHPPCNKRVSIFYFLSNDFFLSIRNHI